MTEPMPMPPPDKTEGMATKHVKSKGEKLFDRITYVGIAGIGTLVITVPIAYELEHHPVIKPYFDSAVKHTEGLLSKLPFKKPGEAAEEVVKTTTLMQGGNLMLLPVGMMEYFKVPIVRGFNAAMKDGTPEQQIEEAPKQTVSSLMKSRGLAWLVVFGSFRTVGHLFKKSMDTFVDEFGVHTVNLMNRFRPAGKQITEAAMKETRTYGYGKIAALDIFATAAAATLLYLGGHFFARKQEERKERREEHKALAKSEPLRSDAVEASTISPSDAPSAQVVGSKQHEGMAREPELAQQI